METRRKQEELYVAAPVEGHRLSLLPIVEITVVATTRAGNGAHVQAGVAVVGLVLTRGSAGWLIWSRDRPYRDFRDALCRHQKEAGA